MYYERLISSQQPLPIGIQRLQMAFDYVGGVGEDQKLFYRSMTYVGKWDWLKRIRRYMVGEDRRYSLKNLKMTFRLFIVTKLNDPGIYDLYLDYSFKNFYIGVERLSRTYNDFDEIKKFYQELHSYNSMLLQ